jgi:hypothetical protein
MNMRKILLSLVICLMADLPAKNKNVAHCKRRDLSV